MGKAPERRGSCLCGVVQSSKPASTDTQAGEAASTRNEPALGAGRLVVVQVMGALYLINCSHADCYREFSLGYKHLRKCLL